MKVRCLKFRIYGVEEMYYLCSENKGADQLWSYCTADLHLCFRICKSRLSHDAAQLSSKATIRNLRSAVLSYRLISIIVFAGILLQNPKFQASSLPCMFMSNLIENSVVALTVLKDNNIYFTKPETHPTLSLDAKYCYYSHVDRLRVFVMPA